MKWTVGLKIVSGFALAIVIMAIIGGSSYYAIIKLTDAFVWKDHTHEVLKKLEGALSLLGDAETGQRGFIITGEERYLEPYHASITELDTKLKEIQELTADNSAQQQRIATIKNKSAEKLAELKETIVLRSGEGFEAAREIVLTDKGKRVMDEIRALITAMETEEITLMEKRSELVDSNTQNAKTIIVGGLLMAVVMLMLTAFLLTRNIAKPLGGLTDAAERIAMGNIQVVPDTDKRRDEVGLLTQTFARMTLSLSEKADVAKLIAAGDLRASVKPQSEKDLLGNALAQMVENLRRTIADTTEGISLLGSSASEILASTTQVAAGTAETATAISETSSTVEEVRQAVRLSSDKAKGVAASAQRVAQVAQSGKQAVEESTAGMLNIRDQMESITQTIVRLSEQSQSIGGIIASVTDLADQSNLLAVNAAIEAARAGEQGKGFTVVAQEVKSLAEQSKQATTQIRSILNDVQKATGMAVMAAEQGSKAVEAGVKQSAQAGEAIRVLAESSGEAAQTATQIVASSQQQSVGMDQISTAMESINQAGLQTAASMQQAEIAAKDLHELGQKLKRLVEQYKT